MKVREVIAYQNYFEDFLLQQPKKVQDKIFKIIEAIETLERVPVNYLKAMEGTNGLNSTCFKYLACLLFF